MALYARMTEISTYGTLYVRQGRRVYPSAARSEYSPKGFKGPRKSYAPFEAVDSEQASEGLGAHPTLA
ncbi:hypothetical protein NDU88_000754 [Pleurodeles waltl]|uniref:Uncharacterized protein n=1 Tax=Pleurodeles waltl TaxID=8319 RepID=A0AAV7S8G6_PLEWA|nr:hypothetical protein NDU88_000754 [Pleurodeles waltl]